MGDGNIWSTVLLFALAGGVLYFLMIRPQQKRQKDQQNLMSSLEPGSRVMLISGIIGTIKYLGEKQAVVEISPGVEMTVDKRAISTQPVVDEFEYADEDDADEAADATEPAVEVEPGAETPVDDAEPVAEAPVDDAEPVAAADDAPEATWDNPDSTKN
ncbi:MAG: preprotein translocase subunit YajC [Propionibacteriaceae bacterium]|nr:preprotein translocase subunit YajC [Propionibacteriaceae bacterium]